MPALKSLADAQLMLNDLTAEIYFGEGFKISARIMLAIHDDSNGDLKPIGT